MNDWGTHGGSRGSRKARLLVLWKPWNCGPTVSTAYDYYGKENKNDGRTSEASGLTTRPPNRVRLTDHLGGRRTAFDHCVCATHCGRASGLPA